MEEGMNGPPADAGAMVVAVAGPAVVTAVAAAVGVARVPAKLMGGGGGMGVAVGGRSSLECLHPNPPRPRPPLASPPPRAKQAKLSVREDRLRSRGGPKHRVARRMTARAAHRVTQDAASRLRAVRRVRGQDARAAMRRVV